MHLEILDSKRVELLSELSRDIQLREYYMAGGTALSLQMGLRRSYDFDFFVPGDFSAVALYRQISCANPTRQVKALNIDELTCDLCLDGIQISFFSYRESMISPYVRVPEFNDLNLAGIEDIAAMKAAAIGGRGAKKDFFDLYHIMRKTDFGVSDLLRAMQKKFGNGRDFSYIGMGLSYFEDAEKEILPETFIKYDWDEIKSYFRNMQESFMDQYRKCEEVSLE